MRLLVAPLEFKGTLTARQAAAAIDRGIHRARPGAETDLLPLADGGPGTVEAVLAAAGGTRVQTRVLGPLGRPTEATWALIRGPAGFSPTAVIEMAAASGLSLLSPEERDPRRASTFGTGQLIAAALGAGCRTLIIGAGGSATNDGGAGALSALGARLLDERGAPLPPGGAALRDLSRVELSSLDPRLRDSSLIVATDVAAPLLGPGGATCVFGPQKGAGAAALEELEAGLGNLARVVAAAVGRDDSGREGAGAAGGLAFGLAALGARIEPGFDLLADLCGLDRRIGAADLVISGEGRLDRQTRMGKGPWRLQLRARALGRPVVLFVGSLGEGAAEVGSEFQEIVPIGRPELAWDELRARASELLEDAALRWAERRQP